MIRSDTAHVAAGSGYRPGARFLFASAAENVVSQFEECLRDDTPPPRAKRTPAVLDEREPVGFVGA
jgi:hypothetical protein